MNAQGRVSLRVGAERRGGQIRRCFGKGLKMVTISLCMIVKNEERILKRCLDSLEGLMDEIIIVDTGSTDATKKIAAAYTDRIYDFVWTGDFSEARNFAFSKAGMDYIYSAGVASGD